MRGGAGSGDNDEQREHREHGQGGETHGPAHEFKLLGALMQVFDSQVAPDPLGNPEHRVVHRLMRELAHQRWLPAARQVKRERGIST